MLVLTVKVGSLSAYEIRLCVSSFVVRAEVLLEGGELAFEEVKIQFFGGLGFRQGCILLALFFLEFSTKLFVFRTG